MRNCVPEVQSVHDAMSRAVDSERDRVALAHANFKLHPAKKEAADQICAQHGTTFSAYLRGCIDVLLEDYMGPRAVQRLVTSGE